MSRFGMPKSSSIPVAVRVVDVNDNKPKFSQLKYEASVPNIFNRNYAQEVLHFEAKDNDLGIYGEMGLRCALHGEDSDKFEIDHVHQKVLLKACATCSAAASAATTGDTATNALLDDLKPVYKFELICKDNQGRGNMGSSSLRISFESLFKQGYTLARHNYYLLASGPSGTEIPSLRIRPLNIDPSNRVTFSVRDPEMAKLFSIDSQGHFRVIASKLTREQSYYMNGTFSVDIGLVDLYGHTETVNVVVQVSEALKNLQCPRIVESAMCRFSINRTTFDPSKSDAKIMTNV